MCVWGVLSSSCKLSTQIPLKMYLSNQSIKLQHRTPFNLFCYPKQVNLQCLFFLWLYDTSCDGLGFPIFSLVLDSTLGKESIVFMPLYSPILLKKCHVKDLETGSSALPAHAEAHVIWDMHSVSSWMEALQVKNGLVLE